VLNLIIVIDSWIVWVVLTELGDASASLKCTHAVGAKHTKNLLHLAAFTNRAVFVRKAVLKVCTRYTLGEVVLVNLWVRDTNAAVVRSERTCWIRARAKNVSILNTVWLR
jgi:hypothetical protein